MSSIVETTDLVITANKTDDRQVAKILVDMAGIGKDCLIRVSPGDTPVYPETTYVISQDTIRRIQREPEIFDATFSVSRYHDLYSSYIGRDRWLPTNRYVVQFSGLNPEVFEGADEKIKQVMESQRPMRQRLWSWFANRIFSRG